MTTLVTGNAGFIGFHVAQALLARGEHVVGLDIINDYYDPALKRARLAQLEATARQHGSHYAFYHADLADRDAVERCFAEQDISRVINLAAQAGVRYSLENPRAYVDSNVVGFTHLLEACREHRVEHLTYASTSSVYGADTQMPFSEHEGANHPLQFYAATKRANELMAHSYSYLYRLPTTGLRFFTVYGPWGRPDMALFKFTRATLAGEPIDVFNHGNHTRDFTYIDDIVEGILRVHDQPAAPNPEWDSDHPDPASSNAPFRLYNIGNNNPVKLGAYIEAIEDTLGMQAQKNLMPRQPGDALDTYADSSGLERAVGYKPSTTVKEGVARFVDWYRDYYRV